MRKRIIAGVAGLGVGASALMFTAGSAQGHGFSTTPTSRQSQCADGKVSGCGAVQHEPQSVEGPKGFPAKGPEDGKLCSAGKGGFGALDDPRGGKWPTTKLQAGKSHTFGWQITAAHRTTDFRYYITKDGWDPSKPLTRADLEKKPFLKVPMHGKQPETKWSAKGKLPAGKKGRHMILGVWNIADTGNAFYSCSDVKF
ncbi:lytic polysaccharide monooxygenase auxiliary activity family 9 protein [Streptomyces sp. ODS28]|uniref:lytic polysaccharide monooxygenase auxiliary activity family 9 protein n=1 Tax=Streptomyces sp. ODS28 TaxID=3136688 RepID=UPI0031E720D3